MKRKLEYNSKCKLEDIDRSQLHQGLEHLRHYHPSYKDVQPIVQPLDKMLSQEVSMRDCAPPSNIFDENNVKDLSTKYDSDLELNDYFITLICYT